MNQPKNIVVNVGLLLDALTQAGGIKRAAAKWRVDQNRINMLFQNKIPRLDCLQRICAGAKLKPSELIMVGGVNAATHNPSRQQKRGLVLLGGRAKRESESQDAG